MPYSDTLRDQIAHLDQRTIELNAQRDHFHQRLEQLQALLTYTVKQQKEFEDAQSSRLHALQSLSWEYLQNRSVTRYMDMMNSTLCGKKASDITENFTQNITKLQGQIEEAKLQIQNIGRILNTVAEDKAWYQNKLNLVLAEERQEQQRRLNVQIQQGTER
jgi:hypothetical protein